MGRREARRGGGELGEVRRAREECGGKAEGGEGGKGSELREGSTA